MNGAVGGLLILLLLASVLPECSEGFDPELQRHVTPYKPSPSTNSKAKPFHQAESPEDTDRDFSLHPKPRRAWH